MYMPISPQDNGMHNVRRQEVYTLSEIVNFINIKYDEFITSCANSWMVKIGGAIQFFPYSLCDLDEKSKVIRCPMWFAIKNEVAQYEDED